MRCFERPRLWGVWLAIALLLAACAGKSPSEPSRGPQPPATSQKLALVIIDGLRYSEGLGDPTRAHVPRMAELAAAGCVVEPFVNDGVTVTVRAVPAIWTGSWIEPIPMDDPQCGGAANQRAAAPTVFEYFRKYLSQPAEECIYLVGDVSCPWRASFDPDYGPSYWPLYDTAGSSDLERWTLAQSILAAEQPDFFLLYLPDVDHAGHGGDWDSYLAAIETADAIVGELWDTLQALPHYAGATTLLVTNDHGRHDDRTAQPHGGFESHGDGCHGCRTIQLLAVGPDIRPGHVSRVPRSIPDIVPTIGALLGFPTEQATGSAMREIFTTDR